MLLLTKLKQFDEFGMPLNNYNNFKQKYWEFAYGFIFSNDLRLHWKIIEN